MNTLKKYGVPGWFVVGLVLLCAGAWWASQSMPTLLWLPVFNFALGILIGLAFFCAPPLRLVATESQAQHPIAQPQPQPQLTGVTEMNTNEQHTAAACAMELSSMLSKHKAALTAAQVPAGDIHDACMAEIYDVQRKYLRKAYVHLLEPILISMLEPLQAEERRRELQEMLEQLNQRFAEALAKIRRDEEAALPQSAQS